MSELALTRITNSCVLLELGDRAVLTDPWFRERWHLHRGEPLGRAVADLPLLTAVVGSHGFPNHWDVASLSGRALDGTVVVTAGARMTARARAAGFRDVRQLDDGDEVVLDGDIRVAACRDHGPAGQTSNVYLFSWRGRRVLFGGEARRVDTVRTCARTHGPAELALLPVNGLQVPGGPRLVMTAKEAVDAAVAAGARTLVPVHDAHGADLVWSFLRRGGSAAQAQAYAAAHHPELAVLAPSPGERRVLV